MGVISFFMEIILSCLPLYEQCLCCDLNESDFGSDQDSDPDSDRDITYSVMYDSNSVDFLSDRIIT